MTENKILGPGLEVPDRTNQTKWTKVTVLALLATIFFGLTWGLLDYGLIHHGTLLYWFWPAFTAAIGVSFLAFVAMVDVSKKLFLGLNFAILILYVWLLPKSWPVVLGGVIFFLFAYLFEKHIRDDEHSRADFSLNRILRSSINFIVYGLLIVLGFNIYSLIKTNFENNPERVYTQIGHYAAAGLIYVPSSVGDFNPNQRFDDFITKQAETQDPQIAKAPKSFQDQAIEEFKKQLVEKFHLQIDGNPLLGEVVAGAVAEKVREGSSAYKQFFPGIFAVLIVVALRYTAFLFVWLTSLVSWLLYRMLLGFRFFRIEKVQVEVDKLQI